MILDHDPGAAGWPERDYRCENCQKIHRYKRTWPNIPKICPVCGGELHRYWNTGGLPSIQMKTELREVRFKLEQEVRQGKRPHARDEKEHSIATL
jgi:hypothetical protein